MKSCCYCRQLAGLAGLILLFGSIAQASPSFEIEATDFFLTYYGALEPRTLEASDVDQMLIDFTTIDGYSIVGTLRIRDLSAAPPVQTGDLQQGLFASTWPLFVDLTNFSVTCTLQPGQSCGELHLDWVVDVSLLVPEHFGQIRASSWIEGTASSGIDVFADSFIDVHNGSGQAETIRGEDPSSPFFVSQPSGAIHTVFFDGTLNAAETTAFVSSGVFQTTNMTGGQSIVFPSSFTHAIGAGPSIVPEPTTIWMFGGGAALLYLARRRRI